MQVIVWGDVRSPGLYEVSQGIKLSTLLTLAGGPNLTRSDRQTVTLQLRLIREQGERDEEVFQATMENGFSLVEGDPVLGPGDALIVERVVKDRFIWRDVLPILSTTASLGVLTLQILRIGR